MMVKIADTLSAQWILFIFLVFQTTFSGGKRLPPELEFSLRTILLSINSSVDPCADFYGFACGNWGRHNFPLKGFLPPGADVHYGDGGIYAYSSLFRDQVEAQLKGALEKDNEATIEGFFYQKCLDSQDPKLYSTLFDWPLANLLRRTSAGHQWPILHPNKHLNLPSWQHLLGTFHFHLDVSPLISFRYPYSDPSQGHQSRLQLAPPSSERDFQAKLAFTPQEISQLMAFWENGKRAHQKQNQNLINPHSFIIGQAVLEVLQFQAALQAIKTPETFEFRAGEKVESEGSFLMTLATFEALTDYPQWTALLNTLLRQSMDQLWYLVNRDPKNYGKKYPTNDFHKVGSTLEVLQLARQLSVSNKRIPKNDPNARKLGRLAALLDPAHLEQVNAWMPSVQNSVNSSYNQSFRSTRSFHFEPESFYPNSFSSSFYDPERDLLNIYDFAYFRRLVVLLERTPPAVLLNYLSLHAISRWQGYLGGTPTGKLLSKFQFKKIQDNPSFTIVPSLPKWKFCVHRTVNVHSWTASYRYLRLVQNSSKNPYKLQKVKQKVTRMVETARVHFEKIIRFADWLDEETRAAALDKLRATKAFVAYPDWLLKDYEEQLSEVHQNELRKVDFLSMAVAKVSFGRVWRHLLLYEAEQMSGSPPALHLDFIGWPDPPIHMTAFQMADKNAITIPLAVLQPPLFTHLEDDEETSKNSFYHHHHETADLLNLGTFFTTIAHELLHSFDQQNSLYDSNGRYWDWWAPGSREKLVERSQCLVRQYRNEKVVFEGYERRGDWAEPVYKTVPSHRTLSEDTADNGALKVAYSVFLEWKQKWLNNRKKIGKRGRHHRRYHSRFLDLSTRTIYNFYTPEQMFFLAHAQFYCSVELDFYEQMWAGAERTHSRERARVNLPVVNLEGGVPFSRAFNCPIKQQSFSTSYSKGLKHQNGFLAERCSVW